MTVLVSLKTGLRFDVPGGSVRAFGFYADNPAPDIDPARIDEGALLVFSVSKIVGVHPDDSIFRDAEFDAPRLVRVRRDAVLGWSGVP